MPKKDHSKKNAFFKLELLVLSALRRQDYYGYEISGIIREHTHGMFDIKDGVLYPLLYRLEQSGYISSFTRTVRNRKRVYYHLESKGISYLDQLIVEYQSRISIIDEFIQWSKQGIEADQPK
ncbi:PadR family transcriptional regulator [Ileibacterium valens]|uniref:Transcription regulator PadR N-terminal domain-containing protein n=2 Tax=Ileibacterium valens TaxID=1862668 RepID=A0A1U7NG34_9FIRM|nr:PadR family transcriptional regulator [Ileibacterium valens]OLU38261.1 hypothetical protein BO224_09420 [Erysipelotrichaceae bacterium NYU-BL-E8]OLU39571.1 hypothetical protein BO222_06420 [Ileibacterium valens]OLU40292.1 hypothetical protein BM735_05785 [Erysipelotrichaceae bacterium NYU-BL-F16]